jgi:hypothetical protein
VKLTDSGGACCTYEVFKVNIINTSPYFITPPTLVDLEV